MALNLSLRELVRIKLELFIKKVASKVITAEDSDKLVNIIVSATAKYGCNSVPCEMPEKFIENINSSFESSFDIKSIYFTEINKVLGKLITLLNTPASCYSIKKLNPTLPDEVVNLIAQPLIISERPAEFWKMYRDVSEAFEPDKVAGWEEYVRLRRYFLDEFSPTDYISEYGYHNEANFKKAKQVFSANVQFSLMHTFLFSLIINSFISDSTIIKKLKTLKMTDIDFEQNCLNLKISTTAYEQNYSSLIMDVRTSIYLKVLVYHLKKSNKAELFGDLDLNRFNAWLATLCKDADVNPMTFHEILKYTKMAASFFMPPYTVCIFTNKLKHVSLDKDFTNRIKNNPQDIKPLDINRNAGFSDLPEKKYKKPKKDVDKHRKLVYQIYGAINIKNTKGENLRAVKAKLEELYSQIKENESSVLLAEWLIYGLGGEVGYDPDLKPSSVKDYFTGFAKDLLSLTFDVPLSILGEDDIAELVIALYETRVLISEDSSNNKVAEGSNSKKVEIKIKHFFDWYRRKYRKDISNSIYDEINLVGAFKTKIRNTILTVKEFDNFLKCLNISDVKHIQKIRVIFILGYFAGLRISEIMKLRKNDVVFGPEPYIFVRQTKSLAGRRKIMIKYLIPDLYLQIIEEYRKTFGSGDNVRIFSKSPEEYKAVRAEVNAFVGAMKRYIGDEGLVFHSLRHSFVSLLFLRYYSAIMKDFDSFLEKDLGAQDPFGINIFDKNRLIQLFGIDMSLGYTNDMLWKFAMITGHLSPETTILNYIHTIDFYIKYKFDKNQNAICGQMSNKQILNLFPTINSVKALQKSELKASLYFQGLHGYLDKKINTLKRH